MISFYLQPADVDHIRFAYSPLSELATSFFLLQRPHEHVHYSRWVNEILPALNGVDFPYMRAAILPSRYIADFITQSPETIQPLEVEFEKVRATSEEVIRDNILYAIKMRGETEARKHFLTHPSEAVECLIAEMRFYWHTALAPHWPRLQTVLENDLLYHAREFALYGMDQMIHHLNPQLRYQQREIQILKNAPHAYQYDPYLRGKGLVFIPTIFHYSGVMWQAASFCLPTMTYTARGYGTWYQTSLPDPEKALEITLGAGRARLLYALQTPAHTTELARQLNLTAGAVSQLLGKLSEAGLVESNRSSKKVYYRLSERGEKLVMLFAS